MFPIAKRRRVFRDRNRTFNHWTNEGWRLENWFDRFQKYSFRIFIVGLCAMAFIAFIVKADYQPTQHPVCASYGPGSSPTDGNGKKVCTPAVKK